MEETKDDSQAVISQSDTTAGGGDISQDLLNQTAQSEQAAPANPASLGLRRQRRTTVSSHTDKSVPHITNLHEDPQMSGIVFTSLNKGEIRIGRKTAEPVPDIILGAIGIQKNHATIKLQENGLFKLTVVPEAAMSTLINGEALTVKKRSRVLNHLDRISFGGCIYVFKYPKLKRALQQLIEASEELKAQENIAEQDQKELAWKVLQEQGLDGVDVTKPETLAATGYSSTEAKEDETAIDWDMAFNEVEMGEMKKQERLNKERDESHKQELERQRAALEEKMLASRAEYEAQKKQEE